MRALGALRRGRHAHTSERARYGADARAWSLSARWFGCLASLVGWLCSRVQPR
jgi:hypothetical protein